MLLASKFTKDDFGSFLQNYVLSETKLTNLVLT